MIARITAGGLGLALLFTSLAVAATIEGTNGPDHLVGTPQADTILGRGGNDTIDGRDGADVLRGHDGKDEILGRDGDDTIYGGDGVDVIFAGGGDDWVNLGPDGAAGEVHGALGNDHMFSQPIGDPSQNQWTRAGHFYGGGGNDIIQGGLYAEGNAGSDQLVASVLPTTLLGGGDNDFLYAYINGVPDLTIDGGSGYDVCWIDSLDEALSDVTGCEDIHVVDL